MGGYTSIAISPNELDSYNADPDGFVAKRFGLTPTKYAEYIEVDGAPLCGATTKKGTPCSVMLGHIQMDVGPWLAFIASSIVKRTVASLLEVS